LRDSWFFFPGPFWARAMRSWLRKESLPIWVLAPSEVKVGSADVECSGAVFRPVALLGTKAEHEDVATAATAARNAILLLENMLVCRTIRNESSKLDGIYNTWRFADVSTGQVNNSIVSFLRKKIR